MKRFALIAAALSLGACAAPTAPAPDERREVSPSLTCRSGYAVAWRDGQAVCVPQGG